jgi:hypothetical protein
MQALGLNAGPLVKLFDSRGLLRPHGDGSRVVPMQCVDAIDAPGHVRIPHEARWA